MPGSRPRQSPFGHSGERAIGTFFSEGAGRDLRDRLSDSEWADLTHFEGNANALRVLTHQFKGRRKGGFAMTYSTLASIVKYPYESILSTKGKFGFFVSERDDYARVADELGILRLSAEGKPLRFARHPLVYIVEAADDICYEVMDIEDAHKLKILSTPEVIDAFLGFFDPGRQEHLRRGMGHVSDPNEKIAYLRSCVVGALVDQCARYIHRQRGRHTLRHLRWLAPEPYSRPRATGLCAMQRTVVGQNLPLVRGRRHRAGR